MLALYILTHFYAVGIVKNCTRVVATRMTVTTNVSYLIFLII